jgi:hypothetical protein
LRKTRRWPKRVPLRLQELTIPISFLSRNPTVGRTLESWSLSPNVCLRLRLSTLGTKKKSIPFAVEFSDGERRDLVLSVELTRRAALWNQVRLRFEPTQLRMKLKNELQLELDLHDPNGSESKS